MKIFFTLKKSLNYIGSRMSEDGLIRFDYKVISFLILLFIFFSLSVLFKLHGSSIGSWDNYLKSENANKKATILGEPKSIRSDEWLVQTPLILSQAENDFPVKNEAIGENKDPLLMNLPARHYSTLFRPQNWGFFIFEKERAFSFYWNAKIFTLILSSFLLLLLLTKNNFWLSFMGVIWIYFSGFIQWWFSTSLPDMIAYSYLITISLIYIFFSERKKFIITASFLFIPSSINFALFFYPAFQVPLFYLSFFIILGLFFQKPYYQKIYKNPWFKIGSLGSASLFIAIIFYFYFQETKLTIEAITSTVYPGKRVSLGGNVSLVKMFSGFTGLPIDEKRVPAGLLNACEASNFLLLFPVVFLATLKNLILKIKNNPLVISLSVYIVALSFWMLFSFPESVARYSLFSMVPSERAILGLGLGSVILVAIFLSEKKDKSDLKFSILGTTLMALFLSYYGFLLRTFDPSFFRLRYIPLLIIIFSFVTFVVLNKRIAPFLMSIFILLVVPNLLVNPVSRGLDSIYDKDISRELVPLLQDSRAIVFGGNVFANFLKSSGINVLNGVNYTPKTKELSVLDPENKFKEIHNRYAHVTVTEVGDEGLEEFELIGPDSYAIKINPCSQKLREIGITRLVFTYPPSKSSLDCLEEIKKSSINNMLLYKYKN